MNASISEGRGEGMSECINERMSLSRLDYSHYNNYNINNSNGNFKGNN